MIPDASRAPVASSAVLAAAPNWRRPFSPARPPPSAPRHRLGTVGPQRRSGGTRRRRLRRPHDLEERARAAAGRRRPSAEDRGTRRHPFAGSGRQAANVGRHRRAQTGNRLGEDPGAARRRRAAPLEFKFLAALALGKAKFVLLGLDQTRHTLDSAGVDRRLLGTVGLATRARPAHLDLHPRDGTRYVLRKLGFRSDAPLFIPGVGAFVLLKQRPVDAREDARIGLAGPWWGLGAAAACYGIYAAGGSPYWAEVARLGAWINLFNLLPVW